mmetsp:Transcript_87869/g.251775  ORF Transcript_87869/g.251775 Transcript_87869/m.251775 type:complete len:224 (-) Transcript_87869:139-810(-)
MTRAARHLRVPSLRRNRLRLWLLSGPSPQEALWQSLPAPRRPRSELQAGPAMRSCRQPRSRNPLLLTRAVLRSTRASLPPPAVRHRRVLWRRTPRPESRTPLVAATSADSTLGAGPPCTDAFLAAVGLLRRLMAEAALAAHVPAASASAPQSTFKFTWIGSVRNCLQHHGHLRALPRPSQSRPQQLRRRRHRPAQHRPRQHRPRRHRSGPRPGQMHHHPRIGC